jgi:hypothetical protein
LKTRSLSWTASSRSGISPGTRIVTLFSCEFPLNKVNVEFSWIWADQLLRYGHSHINKKLKYSWVQWESLKVMKIVQTTGKSDGWILESRIEGMNKFDEVITVNDWNQRYLY